FDAAQDHDWRSLAADPHAQARGTFLAPAIEFQPCFTAITTGFVQASQDSAGFPEDVSALGNVRETTGPPGQPRRQADRVRWRFNEQQGLRPPGRTLPLAERQ